MTETGLIDIRHNPNSVIFVGGAEFAGDIRRRAGHVRQEGAPEGGMYTKFCFVFEVHHAYIVANNYLLMGLDNAIFPFFPLP